MSDWSPAQYARFEDERTRPARDLLAQVPLAEPARIVDMGCGPGNSTELLVERWPSAAVVGLDSSPAMLAEARKRLPKARFDVADATSWVPEASTDLVFANAIYQWLPDHLTQLPRVLGALGKGGVLAVQMPDNLAEPTHELMRAVAADPRWAARLAAAARDVLAQKNDVFVFLHRLVQGLIDGLHQGNPGFSDPIHGPDLSPTFPKAAPPCGAGYKESYNLPFLSASLRSWSASAICPRRNSGIRAYM